LVGPETNSSRQGYNKKAFAFYPAILFAYDRMAPLSSIVIVAFLCSRPLPSMANQPSLDPIINFVRAGIREVWYSFLSLICELKQEADPVIISGDTGMP